MTQEKNFYWPSTRERPAPEPSSLTEGLIFSAIRSKWISDQAAGADNTCYTMPNGINFPVLKFQKTVSIGEYTLPVQATPAWNPNAKHAYMEVAINFF